MNGRRGRYEKKLLVRRRVDGPKHGAHTFARSTRHDLRDLGLGRVLSQCPEEVSQNFTGHRTRALLVKQGERLLVLCAAVRQSKDKYRV